MLGDNIQQGYSTLDLDSKSKPCFQFSQLVSLIITDFDYQRLSVAQTLRTMICIALIYSFSFMTKESNEATYLIPP